MPVPSLQSLPRDIMIMLPEYMHNIEDYTNLSSTCRVLKSCMATTTPNHILKLAAAQSKIFFRPSPLFLLVATAKDLGNWARLSDANEHEFASKCKGGSQALLELALENCGLTLERIRELHLLQYSIINPVVDIIDKCVGAQWQATENFWDGGVSDAYTISADPADTLFHLSIYGELFSPDMEAILDQDVQARRLKVDTRLEFMKYCLPDFQCEGERGYSTGDPRRAVEEVGPYAKKNGKYIDWPNNNNIALTWTIQSSRWKPYWKEMRSLAGPDFQENFEDEWFFSPEQEGPCDWRQRMWENVMMCQGIEGLGMMRPDLRYLWKDKVRMWKNQISKLEREPALDRVGAQATLEYPYILGDLRVLSLG
jgi:hypothetical protein